MIVHRDSNNSVQLELVFPRNHVLLKHIWFPQPKWSLFLLRIYLIWTNSKIQLWFFEQFTIVHKQKTLAHEKQKHFGRKYQNLMFELLWQVGLASIKPNHGPNGVNNLPCRPAIETIYSCADKPLYKQTFYLFFFIIHTQDSQTHLISLLNSKNACWTEVRNELQNIILSSQEADKEQHSPVCCLQRCQLFWMAGQLLTHQAFWQGFDSDLFYFSGLVDIKS